MKNYEEFLQLNDEVFKYNQFGHSSAEINIFHEKDTDAQTKMQRSIEAEVYRELAKRYIDDELSLRVAFTVLNAEIYDFRVDHRVVIKEEQPYSYSDWIFDSAWSDDEIEVNPTDAFRVLNTFLRQSSLVGFVTDTTMVGSLPMNCWRHWIKQYGTAAFRNRFLKRDVLDKMQDKVLSNQESVSTLSIYVQLYLGADNVPNTLINKTISSPNDAIIDWIDFMKDMD